MNDRPLDQTDALRAQENERTEKEGGKPASEKAVASVTIPLASDQEPGTPCAASAGTSEFDVHEGGTTDSAPSENDDLFSLSPGSAGISTPGLVGATVGGYEILGILGQGAMGVVYKARQRGLKRLVALKMISAGAHASERDRARFRVEAEAVARLQHPNIVQVHEVGEQEGRPFFSLEYVEGGSLAKKINGTPQTPRYAAEVVRILAVAMDYAHQHGIIHRDLKPANILLSADGTPKIADFGLAKSLEEESVHTQTGTIMGTPSYMSSEQAGGNTREIGPPTDIYALGAILYDLLTGRPPFRGTTLWETVSQVKTQEPVSPRQFQPGVPLDLETICLKCLQKEAGKRYARAADLAEDLHRFLAGEAILGRPLSSPERLWRWCRRNPWLAGLGSASALLLAAWAVSSTILYVVIKEEMKETDRQRKIAMENETIAIEKEAIARQREEEANQQRKRAEKNADELKDQFVRSVARVQGLIEKLTRGLQAKPGRPVSPETAALRKEILQLARTTMTEMSRDFNKANVSPFGMVLVCQKMGELLSTLGLSDEALQQYHLGVEAARLIVKAQPDNDTARGNLAFMLGNLGKAVLEAKGDVAAANECFREALETNGRVLANLPADPAGLKEKKRLAETFANQVRYHGNLADCAGLMWDPADSRRCLTASLAFWKSRSDAYPKDALGRSYLAQTHSLLGDACSWCADDQATAEHHQAAIRLCESLVKDFPRQYSFPADLAMVWFARADAYLRAGKADDAARIYRQFVPVAEAAVKKNPISLWVQFVRAEGYTRMGWILRAAGQPGQAEQFTKALAQWEDLAAKQLGNTAYQAALCVALARCGKFAAAREKIEGLLQRAKNNPDALIQGARCFALCAGDPTAEKAPIVDRALGLLEQAVKQGYRNAVALKKDPEWKVLATDARFGQLLARIMQHNSKMRSP